MRTPRKALMIALGLAVLVGAGPGDAVSQGVTFERLLNERFADGNVDLLDGIKVFEERGWVQVLPDPDEPLIHIYAEGRDAEGTAELEREARELVTEITSREETLAKG